MTVRDLIEKLAEFAGNAEIQVLYQEESNIQGNPVVSDLTTNDVNYDQNSHTVYIEVE